jgi:protein-disulfide isomerase
MLFRSFPVAFALTLCVMAASPASFAQQSTQMAIGSALTPAQRAEVIALIRQELVQDPSILRNAIASLQAQDQASQAAAQGNAIAADKTALTGNPADPVIGNPQGRVSVVEFYDTRCPYCREMRPELTELVHQDPNVRVIFKDIPILGPNSIIEARALLAAQRQGGYASMQAALMTDTVPPTDDRLRTVAKELGMNPDRLIRDISDPAIAAKLAANTALAQSLGINGTPAIIVGNQLVPGAISLSDLQKLVDQAQAG